LLPQPYNYYRKKPAPRKHVPKPKPPDDAIIRRSREEEPYVIARVHQGRTHGSAFLGPVLGDERRSNSPLSANPDPGQKAKKRQGPNSGGERCQEGEERKRKNAEHHGPHAAEAVGYGPPNHAGSPTHHEK